ncbi:MAG: hypothetical protein FWG63_11560 [Defluviitaleaceae bacterium]|nr:hypothetical protein [Defluviitaleaceae bacterium]
METRLTAVNVSQIAEYNTQLGTRCAVLDYYGLNAYTDTEEALKHALDESANDAQMLEICKNLCRCKAFWQSYQKGVTPFLDEEPIRMLQENGKYWVIEGKHRTCMAKRSGVKTMQAIVFKSNQVGRELLPSCIRYGNYEFSYTHNLLIGSKRGTYAFLWLRKKYFEDDEFKKAQMLTSAFNTNAKEVELADGLHYSVSVIKKLFHRTVTVTVKIKPIHEHIGIWLMSVPVDEFRQSKKISETKIKTHYRKGCWRKYHLDEFIEFRL